jgi:hypothetical protein
MTDQKAGWQAGKGFKVFKVDHAMVDPAITTATVLLSITTRAGAPSVCLSDSCKQWLWTRGADSTMNTTDTTENLILSS